MAYVVTAAYVNEVSQSALLAVPIPSGYEANDLLLVFPTQDGGTGTLAMSGWSDIFSVSQVAANAQRTWGFKKVASSSSEPDGSVSSGISENMGAIVIVVRGADPTTPIEDSAIVGTTARPMLAPQLTTTTPNCLILMGSGNDSQTTWWAGRPGDFVFLAKGASGGAACIAGYSYMDGIGDTPQYPFYTYNGQSGQTWAVAIRDDGNNKRRGYIKQGPEWFRFFGRPGLAYDPSDSWAAPSSLTASIDGITCSPDAPTINTSSNVIPTRVYPTDATSDEWGGGVITFASELNLQDKIACINFDGNVTSTVSHRYLLAFVDNNGNWSAFEHLNQTDRRSISTVGTVTIPSLLVSNNRPRDFGSGTLNWGRITKMAFLISMVNGNAGISNFVLIKNFFAIAKGGIEFIPGRGQSDWTMAADLYQALVGSEDTYADKWGALLGSGMAVSRLPIQIGSTSAITDGEVSVSAVEGEKPYAAAPISKYFRVADFDQTFSVRCGADDTLTFSSALLSFPTPSIFEIDAASSPSATYDFSGLTLSKTKVKHLAPGVVMNGTLFAGCYTVEASGEIDRAAFVGALESPACKTADPGLITDCSFTQGDAGGHAIEITAPGTYTFAGNTFSGYGADGTTDAAIYNNSGGTVVLNITGGGDTPTVRNASGLTTTINSGATLTLTGLVAGSDIVILDAGTSTERVNVDANAGTTYGYGYTATGAVDIGVFKAGYVPYYIRNFTLTTADATLPVAQVVDRAYSNP